MAGGRSSASGGPRLSATRAERRPLLAWLGLGAWLAACSPSAPARVALQGDLPGLKAAIVEAEREQALDAAHTRELAGAVLRRELVSLAAPSETFPDVLPCAAHVRSALEQLASGSSEYSAAAALALIDAGYDAPDPGAADAVSRDAIEARQAVGERAGSRRRAFMLHGAATVRRAALSAALAEPNPGDIAALGEAARLDPDALARAIAIRALGRIGGERAVLALGDAYAAAGPPERREIVYAWSLPASFEAGGGRALEDLVAGPATAESVLAAVALAERSGEVSPLAVALLSKAIEGKLEGARLLALALAPWSSPELRGKLVAARRHEDAATRALALSRAVTAGALDADGRQELERLASDRVTGVGVVARAALARSGHAAVKPALRADLDVAESRRRRLAARALAQLGDWAGAARALGDDSPEVRRSVACDLLAEPEASAAADPGVFRPAFAGPEVDVVPLLLSAKPG